MRDISEVGEWRKNFIKRSKHSLLQEKKELLYKSYNTQLVLPLAYIPPWTKYRPFTTLRFHSSSLRFYLFLFVLLQVYSLPFPTIRFLPFIKTLCNFPSYLFLSIHDISWPFVKSHFPSCTPFEYPFIASKPFINIRPNSFLFEFIRQPFIQPFVSIPSCVHSVSLLAVVPPFVCPFDCIRYSS